MKLVNHFLISISIYCILYNDGIFANDVDTKSKKDDEKINHGNNKINVVRSNTAFSSNKIFKATNEWQDVPDGVGIPQGLHVKMNLQTGKTQAKLLDEKDKVGVQPSALIPLKEKAENEKKVPKEIPQKKAEDKPKLTKEDIIKKYESLKELRKEFEKARQSLRTDFEIINDIFVNYKLTAKKNADQHLIIISDIEPFLHQIDNAIYFANLGGFKIALMDLNSSSISIQIETLRLIGTAIQGNPSARDILLQNPLAIQRVVQLLTLVDTPFGANEFNSKANYVVLRRKRALFALSAIVRGHPISQQLLYNITAFQSMMNIFELKDPQIRIKLVTFLTDIISEQIEMAKGPSANYRIPLQQLLKKSTTWCRSLSKLLSANRNHDDNEKILRALEIGIPEKICDFKEFKEIIEKTREFYQHTYDNDRDPYFKMLLDICSTLLDISNGVVKHEL